MHIVLPLPMLLQIPNTLKAYAFGRLDFYGEMERTTLKESELTFA